MDSNGCSRLIASRNVNFDCFGSISKLFVVAMIKDGYQNLILYWIKRVVMEDDGKVRKPFALKHRKARPAQICPRLDYGWKSLKN